MSPRSGVPTGRVEALAFAAEDVVVLMGTSGSDGIPTGVSIMEPPTMVELAHSVHALGESEERWLLLASASEIPTGASAIISMPSGSLVAGAPDLAGAAMELQEFLLKLVELTEPHERPAVIEWFAGFEPSSPPGERQRWSQTLNMFRDVLREHLPVCELRPEEPLGLSLDLVLAADDHTFYLKGWFRHTGTPVTRVSAVSPEGHRVELLDSAFRHHRDDVNAFYEAQGYPADADLGFIATISLPTASTSSDGWLLEMVALDGSGVEARGPSVQRDLATVRDLMVYDLVYERAGTTDLRSGHLRPALDCVQRRRHEALEIVDVDTYGDVPDSPEVTLIVPLYRKLEFLEHQMAQFVHDPEIAANELLYVLDSPEDAAWLRHLATNLHPLYQVPFRIAFLSANGGFAAANNYGASVATGQKLLLLNSDVLPSGPGWLGEMIRFYDGTPNIGALGVKLLYEDESLQHAGLFFQRVREGGLWNNEHMYKGLHRGFAPANVTRPVPAVTAACLLIDRTLYQDLGGLSPSYLQGDFEDSDLCLRLKERGMDSWYLPTVELYHLEGQSYPSDIRTRTTEYNQWLHSDRFDEMIRGFEPSSVAIQTSAPPTPSSPRARARQPSRTTRKAVKRT